VQSTDCVFITGRDSVIEYANPSFERLTGYSSDKALERTAHLLRSGQYAISRYRGLSRDSLGPYRYGWCVYRKTNGDRPVEGQSTSPVRDETACSPGYGVTEGVFLQGERLPSRTLDMHTRPPTQSCSAAPPLAVSSPPGRVS
jgi:PAS domain S-box-containing protein